MIIITTFVLGILATSIGAIIYKSTLTNQQATVCKEVTNLIVKEVDGNKVNSFLENGETEDYLATKERLISLYQAMQPTLTYLYVYQIREDGCYVVFDLDSENLDGDSLGSKIDFDEDFYPYLDKLLKGEEIEPITSHGTYGWLLTVYQPIFDSTGKCVCYAAADVSMENLVTTNLVFVIKMISLLFGSALIIMGFVIRFSKHSIIEPINKMAKYSTNYAYSLGENRLQSEKEFMKLDIQTGDEIEYLYSAFKKTIELTSNYLDMTNEKSRIITQMQDNIIVSLANMVENRDGNTGLHIKRTALYAYEIGKALQKNTLYRDVVTSEYLQNLKRSAPLHDIGKIKISDVILNKPGKLTKEEYEIMKTHTTEGKKILLTSLEGLEGENYLKEAINVATYHHEKWDGTGYPEGLKGCEIPLSARIMAVADVFDALMSKRSYKEPYGFTESVSIIQNSSGTQFDPDIVAAFLSCLEEVKKISECTQQ